MSSPNRSSSILLRVCVPRLNSAVGATLGAVMTTLCVFGLWRSLNGPVRMPLLATVFLVLIGLAMLWVAAYFVGSIIRPPVMLEATPLGLLTYLNLKSHRYVDHAQLIPWQTILHIDYFRAVAIPSYGRGQRRIDTVRVQLKPGHALPIDDLGILGRLRLFEIDASRNTGIDWDNTVFLDARTDFGTPQSLTQQLEDLRQVLGDPSSKRVDA